MVIRELRLWRMVRGGLWFGEVYGLWCIVYGLERFCLLRMVIWLKLLVKGGALWSDGSAI